MVQEAWNAVKNIHWLLSHSTDIHMDLKGERIRWVGGEAPLHDLELPLEQTPWYAEAPQ